MELQGRTEEARKELQQLLELLEAKGDIIMSGRIRARLDELATVAGAY